MHFINAKTILTPRSMNIYRGCLHGCIYCDSRSLCYQFKHQFEDVEVKQNAPELLEDALRKKRKRCMIGTGSMGDPYIPPEKELRIMRRCLEIIERGNFGATLITKSDLVLRDLDLLAKINRKTKAVLQMTLTTYDDRLCKLIEPGVCPTSKRFETLCKFRDEGIPTVVWLSPLLPFINDTVENLDGILDMCIRAKVKGIVFFGIGLTLRDGNREYFYRALDRNFPGLKEKYVRNFGQKYEAESPNSSFLIERLKRVCKENEMMLGADSIFKWIEEFPDADPLQPELF